MLPALLIGRGGSQRLPMKNVLPVLGRPLMAYPLLAACNSEYIDCIYLSTDSQQIRRIGQLYGATILERPPELATHSARVEDVIMHGYQKIMEQTHSIEIFVLLFCNAATLTSELLDRGIEYLRSDPSLDSVVTVSMYNRYSPHRAMKLEPNGLLSPYMDLPSVLHNDDCYFCNGSLWIFRPRCLENKSKKFPFPWVGERVRPMVQEAIGDINYDYEIALAEHWLRKQGFTETTSPYVVE
jgi:CMP-N-acetylneuraminic acid synthetase